MGGVVGGRAAWALPLAAADLAGRHPLRHRSSNGGQLAAAAGVSTEFSDYYYFIAAWDASPTACHRLLLLLLRRLPCGDHVLLALDDSPPSVTARRSRGRASTTIPRPAGRRQIPLRHHLGHLGLGRATSAVGTIGLPCGRRSTSGRKISPSCPKNSAGSFGRNSNSAR